MSDSSRMIETKLIPALEQKLQSVSTQVRRPFLCSPSVAYDFVCVGTGGSR